LIIAFFSACVKKVKKNRTLPYFITAHTTVPLIAAVTGIATIVKVRQNFELRAYLADKLDCIL
jgi:hypothetical protein